MSDLFQQFRRNVDKSGSKENESGTRIWRKLKRVMLDVEKESLNADFPVCNVKDSYCMTATVIYSCNFLQVYG